MPEPPVAATLDARVAELVEARRPALEQLVRDRVDAELARLVDVELERALNRLAATSTNGATPVANGATPARELCARCGERPRAAHRTLCGPCRHARDRERHAAPATDDDGPRTGPPAPPG